MINYQQPSIGDEFDPVIVAQWLAAVEAPTLNFEAFAYPEWAIVARAAFIDKLERMGDAWTGCPFCSTMGSGWGCANFDREDHLCFSLVRADKLAAFYRWQIDEVLSR